LELKRNQMFMMSTNAEKFMLEEYEQNAKAFFSLHTQKNNLLKNYLAFMSVGSAALGFVYQILPIIFSKASLEFNTKLLAFLIWILVLIGIITFTAIIGVRHDMIFYAKTVNEVRGYFANKYKKIKPYLVLPISREYPHFFETPSKYFFWELLLVGIVNSSLFLFSMIIISIMQFVLNFWLLFSLALCIVTHIAWYYYLSYIRKKEFQKTYKKK